MAITRRYFFFGSLLAGAVPPGRFCSAQSLKHLGYKLPNEKLNLATIGGGGQAFNDISDAKAGIGSSPRIAKGWEVKRICLPGGIARGM